MKISNPYLPLPQQTPLERTTLQGPNIRAQDQEKKSSRKTPAKRRARGRRQERQSANATTPDTHDGP